MIDGIAIIKDNLKRLPASPGVYRMLNEKGEVLYVGKAKILKNRVASYTRLGGHNQRIARMIQLTRSMEFVVTQTETEALLLEANLIKKLKPRYNILMRDDKSFPYILISGRHEAPQLKMYRGSKAKANGTLFGPFANSHAVRRTLDTLQKAFLLRTCEDSIYEGRSRPCMLYEIKRCAAPCTGVVSPHGYAELVADAMRFLNGKSTELKRDLSAKMDTAAEAENYEEAGKLRDRIRALATIQATQNINPGDIAEADVFGLHVAGGKSCVQVFFIRAGQNWGAHAFYPRHDTGAEPQEIMMAFLAQFYEKRPPPKLILVSDMPAEAALLAEALANQAGHKLDLHKPQRGDKVALVETARRNAQEALARKMAEADSQAGLLAEVEKAFNLPRLPQRIEIYDNSHIQGTNAVGGMVVAGPEGFIKPQYRKFSIKDGSVAPGDDYGMMREVMRRRFARLKTEAGQDPLHEAENYPDLVLIDGGQGQLTAVLEALADIGLGPKDLNIVAIAKGPDRNAGRETFFMAGRGSFKVPEKSPLIFYLQRLRDEAHRWAIGAHRAKRSADIKKNPLDEIEGIGPARKKALLHHFGSAKGVAAATIPDLRRVDGVSAALADKIHGFFRG